MRRRGRVYVDIFLKKKMREIYIISLITFFLKDNWYFRNVTKIRCHNVIICEKQCKIKRKHLTFENIFLQKKQKYKIDNNLYYFIVYRISQVKDCPFRHLKYLNIRDNNVGPEGATEKAFQILPEDMYLETDRWDVFKKIVDYDFYCHRDFR